MNQAHQTGIDVSGIRLWTTSSNTGFAESPESAQKGPSIRHSVAACAVLLAYIAIYMSVGFAALALVARAWLALFE